MLKISVESPQIFLIANRVDTELEDGISIDGKMKPTYIFSSWSTTEGIIHEVGRGDIRIKIYNNLTLESAVLYILLFFINYIICYKALVVVVVVGE